MTFKMILEKTDGNYYVYLERDGKRESNWFLNSGLAVNWAERYRASLIRKGHDVKTDIRPGFLSPQ